MINLVQDGEKIEYSNSSGSTISAGSIVKIGNRIGVAVADILDGDSGTVSMEGAFKLSKTTGAAWSQGDDLFYDAGTSKLTKVATGNTFAGYAFAAALSADTEGVVNLQPMPKQATVIAAVATADGSDAATTLALANALKASYNSMLAALKAAGLMANS